MTLRFPALAALSLASPAFAHPGHGASGWLHGLAPEHLAPGLAVAAFAAAALLARRGRRAAREQRRTH